MTFDEIHKKSNFILQVWLMQLLPITTALCIIPITTFNMLIQNLAFKPSMIYASGIAIMLYISLSLLSLIAYQITLHIENKKGE